MTDFFHQANADIHACQTCTLLVRQEREGNAAASYSEDSYAFDVIDQQYPRYLQAFRAKEQPYRSLLPPGHNSVIEVGSHYGAFLQTAAEWGWHAEGVDVGKETTAYARKRGFTVHSGELADAGLRTKSIDAIFVWNCFEQIADPHPLLTEARRVLRDGGLLVLRTPNGLFYRTARQMLHQRDVPEQRRKLLIDALGYNNLLGFPYLYGHSRETLAHLAGCHGFREEGSLNSTLITLPLPDPPAWVESEERQIDHATHLLEQSLLERDGIMFGPWIETFYCA